MWLLNENNHKIYRLIDVAKELNCSPSAIKKILCKELGQSFSRYYADLKISSAKKI
jgi:AraC-like DNA-binding protein